MKRRSFLAGLIALGAGSKLGPLPTPAPALAVSAAGVSVGPLTAPGGWCAPSETVYELMFRDATVWREYSGGVLNLADHLPEIRMQRGGIKFTEEP